MENNTPVRYATIEGLSVVHWRNNRIGALQRIEECPDCIFFRKVVVNIPLERDDSNESEYLQMGNNDKIVVAKGFPFFCYSNLEDLPKNTHEKYIMLRKELFIKEKISKYTGYKSEEDYIKDIIPTFIEQYIKEETKNINSYTIDRYIAKDRADRLNSIISQHIEFVRYYAQRVWGVGTPEKLQSQGEPMDGNGCSQAKTRADELVEYKDKLRALLPDSLKTDKAIATFANAIKEGYIVFTEQGLRWKNTMKGERVKLAYLCGKIYGCNVRITNYQTKKRKSLGKPFPGKALNALFGIERLQDAFYDKAKNQNRQRWEESIDRLIAPQ